MKKWLPLILIALSWPALAWQPSKPIEAVIGFAPGSVNELLMRTLSREVEKNTSAQFAIINRPGAGGVVGSEYFSRRPGDGHHVMMVSLIGLTAMDMVAVPDPSKGRSYDLDSFTYVIGIATTAFAVVANAKDNVSTAAEFVRVAANDRITLGSSGGSRIVYETLNLRMPNNQMAHVSYGAPAQQIVDVMGGSLRFAVVPAAAATGFMAGSDGDRIKIVAVTSGQPLKQWPQVRTLSSVSPDLVLSAAWGLLLPAGTAKPVQDWYVREFTKALESESVIAIYEKNLLSPMHNALNAEDFRAWVIKEHKKNSDTVRAMLSSQTKK